MASHIPSPLAGNDLAAYSALHSGAVAFARPALHHLVFDGAKAADTLTGLVTNDVLALAEGGGHYAAALTAKGRVVADMRIVRLEAQRYLTTTSHAAWSGWHDLVRKFVNPRFAKYSEVPLETRSVHGPASADVVREVVAAIVAGAGRAQPEGVAQPEGARPADAPSNAARPGVTLPDAPHACVTLTVGEDTLRIIASPALGDIVGYDLLVPPALLEAVDAALAAHAGVTAGTDAAWDVARVESGRPAWGKDMDESTIPQEANLGDLGAISFEKGCYTGQETVARIHFRGHVNRHLRVLRSAEPLPVPSELRADDGKVIGDVRSSVISPTAGPIAIAMVRREIAVGGSVAAYAKDSSGTKQTVTAEVAR